MDQSIFTMRTKEKNRNGPKCSNGSVVENRKLDKFLRERVEQNAKIIRTFKEQFISQHKEKFLCAEILRSNRNLYQVGTYKTRKKENLIERVARCRMSPRERQINKLLVVRITRLVY